MRFPIRRHFVVRAWIWNNVRINCIYYLFLVQKSNVSIFLLRMYYIFNFWCPGALSVLNWTLFHVSLSCLQKAIHEQSQAHLWKTTKAAPGGQNRLWFHKWLHPLYSARPGEFSRSSLRRKPNLCRLHDNSDRVCRACWATSLGWWHLQVRLAQSRTRRSVQLTQVSARLSGEVPRR